MKKEEKEEEKKMTMTGWWQHTTWDLEKRNALSGGRGGG